ncbi:hypothetical protein E4U02_14000 [Microbacterium paludicola]|uniref:Sulfotransferase family protein n=2 Tax=Microbacterium paludicola TaxID=300019 RepID=A0A4Y9FNY3_9MICO|nr:sulfotransferase family 2 domain-containing protein [Microbacterium paludicola]TFU30924.1 hypothetical protein E4U02_14000 [Microbacterium paludicola]
MTTHSRSPQEPASTATEAETPIEQASADPTRRPPAILHYHLFKNAGTSLDAMFQQYFGDRWTTREFPSSADENRRQVQSWLSADTADCYSTHTGFLPPPELSDREVFPIVFLRHPLDRIASAYSFERRQRDSGFGSTLARNTTLRGYIDVRLSIPTDRQCRDFHANRLAHLYPQSRESELERATRALEDLPFVGVVEQFDASLARLESLLRERGYDDIQLEPVRRNISAERSDSLEDRLAALREDVGEEFYERLLEANRGDIELHRIATDQLANITTAADSE